MCLCDKHFLLALFGKDATGGDSCCEILEVSLAYQRNGREMAERTEEEGRGVWRDPMLFIWEEIPRSWVASWAYNLTLFGKAVSQVPEVTVPVGLWQSLKCEGILTFLSSLRNILKAVTILNYDSILATNQKITSL